MLPLGGLEGPGETASSGNGLEALVSDLFLIDWYKKFPILIKDIPSLP